MKAFITWFITVFGLGAGSIIFIKSEVDASMEKSEKKFASKESVDTMKEDVTEIKTDVKAVNSKVDQLLLQRK